MVLMLHWWESVQFQEELKTTELCDDVQSSSISASCGDGEL